MKNPLPFVAAMLATFVASLAMAGEMPYDAQRLDAAQRSGAPVAVVFHADWCPTCRAQDKALQSLKTEKGLDITVLTVNYDTEKDLKRRFKINSQSTFVVLKGEKESARLVGDTSALNIMTALKSAL